MTVDIQNIGIAEIDPSPFQHRQHFDVGGLKELARSIEDDGLIQPITVRRVADRFELIAGERRWRACRDHAEIGEISARVLECDDLQARRLCAVENLQRADLTAIEEVQALAELLDSEFLMAFGDEYSAMSKVQEPKFRVKALLTLIESDRRNETEKVTRKFVGKTQELFAGLPKPKDLRSFADHDLPLLFTDDEVQRFAMQHRLNKSQTKAVSKLAKQIDVKEALGDDTGKSFISIVKDAGFYDDDVDDVRDLSAQDINRVASRERLERRHELITEETRKESKSIPATISTQDALEWLDQIEPADLLITDPPYSTDIEDIAEFADTWLPKALSKVKKTGRAFVFVGAYPEEMQAYMDVAMPEQILVWTYRNTLGPAPKYDYKLNWQAILYYRMPEAEPLNCPIMLEQFSVQDINAPDGRLGDRYHAWQKPLDIGQRFIRHSTREGDTVIDPFACTGTFLLAASGLGRQGFGCDIDEANVQIAIDRGCQRG